MPRFRTCCVRRVAHSRQRPTGSGRLGGTLIETAVSLSLLLMLTLGSTEFGYFFYVKNVIAGAARNGVRAAVPAGATNADVTSAVTTAMAAAHLAPSTYTVTISPADVSTVTPGTPITVTVSATWGTIGVTPLATAMGGISNSKIVTTSAVMQREQ